MRDDVAEPTPEAGQVLVSVKACGICGSDLHFAEHAAEMTAIGEEMGGLPMRMPSADLSQDVFMGHEFAAEVLEAGPGTDTFAPGTLVTSIPVLLSGFGMSAIGFGNAPAAGYGERMVLSAPLLQEVPNGLDARRAALTEPMAVGLHAVNRARLEPGDGTIVLGCGPVGLAVIASLRLRGVGTILAADFSPARRALAATMGATQVIDPAAESVFDIWLTACGTKPPVVFEAVGVTGMIDAVLRDVVPQTRVVIVGVCMGRDPITPLWAITKELNLQFVLGYDLEEFAGTLRSIAEGDVDVDPLITGEVGLDDVPGAFDALGNPDQHCKILVTP